MPPSNLLSSTRVPIPKYKRNSLKVKCRQYPSIHINYIISHCTTLQYNHNYLTRYLGRNDFANAKYNEFNSAAISLLGHPPPMLCRGQINVAGITATVEHVKIALSEKIALLLHPHVDVPYSLVVT